MKQKTKRVEKPWGYEIIFAHTPQYVGKILHINKGEALSTQYHNVKDETLYVNSGEMKLEYGDDLENLETLIMKPGDSFHVTPKLIHKMTALADVDVCEVSTPELDDVVRLADRYGRTGTTKA